MRKRSVMKIAIIGGGPAGLTAAIYALRNNFEVVLFEKGGIGGQAAITNEVENYPAFKNISGFELTNKMYEQAENFGLKTKYEEIVSVKPEDGMFLVKTEDDAYIFDGVILAMGASAKALGIENEFVGRGVSYCATCDGNFFKEKTVAVVGGGNTAVDDALYLSNIAKKVYLIHRREGFRAAHMAVERVKRQPNVEFVTNAVPVRLEGGDVLEKVIVKTCDGEREIKTDALFVAVGQKPNSDCVKGLVDIDENGYILTNGNLETCVKGLYAAGDVRQKTLRQIVTATGDGAVAATNLIMQLLNK